MRASANRHPVAILREIVGLGQKELAALLECSPATIQSVELGRLKLSQELALRISLKTGASVAWLLNGDPSAPIINRDGEPYGTGEFESAQGTTEKPEEGELTPAQEFTHDYLVLSAWLFEILEKSRLSGTGELAAYKTRKALYELASEFGAELEMIGFMPSRVRDMIAALTMGVDTAAEMFESLEKSGVMDEVRAEGNLAPMWSGLEHHKGAPMDLPDVKVHCVIPPKGHDFHHPHQPTRRSRDRAIRKRD